MSTNVRRKILVKHGFTSIIHVFPRAMRQQKRPFLRLQKLLSLNQVDSLQIYHILDNNDSVGKVESRGFLNLEPPNHVLQRVKKRFMHTLLVANSRHFPEEETRNRRQIERELIGHDPRYARNPLKKLTVLSSEFKL